MKYFPKNNKKDHCYKINDIVKIIGNKTHHNFDIGEKIQITELKGNSETGNLLYRCIDLKNKNYWYVYEIDMYSLKTILKNL